LRRGIRQSPLHQEAFQFGPHLQRPIFHLIERDHLFLILLHHPVVCFRRLLQKLRFALLVIRTQCPHLTPPELPPVQVSAFFDRKSGDAPHGT
jgi:hypothetical protein